MRGEELLIFTSWNIQFLKNEKIKVLRMQEISSNPVLILILIESSSSNKEKPCKYEKKNSPLNECKYVSCE